MARAAMIAFLKSDALARPHRISASPEKDHARSGILTAGFEEGSILLKSKGNEYYRVSWKKDDADRRRAVPAGEYVMIGYTLVRRDKQDKEWFVGTSGKMIRKLAVRAGEEQPIALQDFIHLHCRTQMQAGKLQVQMVIQGEHHSGLTLYHEGKRIPVGYRVTDSQGKEVAMGQLEYG